MPDSLGRNWLVRWFTGSLVWFASMPVAFPRLVPKKGELGASTL
jgi:hypothetical protein